MNTPYLSNYNPRDWYWIRPNGQSVFSSKRGVEVPLSDLGYQAFLTTGNTATPWPNSETGEPTVEALYEVLSPYGLDPVGRVKARLDEFAETRGYDSITTATTYATSTNTSYAAEGQKAVELRDATWAAYFDIIRGNLTVSWDEIVISLPILSWS